MKKIYILAAIALVAGVSCTKQVPADNNSPDMPIGFNPISQKVRTKAIPGEQSATYSLANGSGYYESFKTWARYSDAKATKPADATVDFWTGGIVCNPNQTGVPDYWELATKYYWPKSGYLSFHAFSPSDLNPTETWGTGFELAYTVNTDASAQIDVMYSNYELGKARNHTVNDFATGTTVSRYDDETDGTHKYDGVDITFNHALASIGFKAKIEDDNYTTQGHKFIVKKIEILYPYQTGTFHENRDANSTSNGYASVVPAASTGFENIGYKWDTSVKSPYWTVNQSSELDPATGTYVAFNGTSAQLTTTAATLYNTPGALVSGANYVLAMPQNLAHSTNTVSVKVTYTYQFKSGTEYTLNTTVPLYKTGLHGSDANETTYTGDIDKWLINHKYIYTLNFKLDDIIFDPAVENFVQVDVAAIDLPDIDA